MQKLIGEVFSDYKTESNIKEAKIESLNLIKKANVLEVNLESDKYIEIKEIWYFEKFLKERFQFSNTDIKIKYEDAVTISPIEKEWENLICYMIHKYPLMKPMILLKSTIEIENGKIIVKMKIRGADFLRSRKLDRELERVMFNIFGFNYKVQFTEEINEEEQKALEAKREFTKKQAIVKALEHMTIGEQIAKKMSNNENKNVNNNQNNNNQYNSSNNNENSNNNEYNNNNSQNNSNNNTNNIPLPKVAETPTFEEEETPIIYGRSQKLKTNIIKVIDISPEDDMAAISGEILKRKYGRKGTKKRKIFIIF